MSKTQSRAPQRIDGVEITHPGREIFPGEGVSKAGLARYYAAMADLIFPQIEDRPISLVRCPEGLLGDCFYQRAKGRGMPDSLAALPLRHDGESHAYMYLTSREGLAELVQMGVIEIHPWSARRDDISSPDRLIFDLDPAPGVAFDKVKQAAVEIRGRLDKLGLAGFVKTTGGKGLHVIAPVERRRNWAETRGFAERIARQMAADSPARYTLAMRKDAREGRIFLDYFRNQYAATAVMDYSVRARPGAPVATPLKWRELADLKSADQFHMANMEQRRKTGLDLLKSQRGLRQSITKKMLRELGVET